MVTGIMIGRGYLYDENLRPDEGPPYTSQATRLNRINYYMNNESSVFAFALDKIEVGEKGVKDFVITPLSMEDVDETLNPVEQ